MSNKEEKKVVYLDNNATTQVAPEVVEAMLPFLTQYYGNPSSIHTFGGRVKYYVDKAREQVAVLLGAKPSQIYFTGCGSESDNMVIQGFFNRHKQKTRIITSTVEHAAVRNLCHHLVSEGAQVIEVPVDGYGRLNLDFVKNLPMDENTLLSFMWANNETGVLFPIEELTEIAKSQGAYFHTDAVQAVGKVTVSLSKVPIDFLALSGHKLHAPKGVGVVFIRDTTDIVPLIFGGHQENSIRAGTENVASIVGLGEASELAMKFHEEETVIVKRLRDKLETELLAKCDGAKLNGDPVNRLPNTTNISFEFVEGESILLFLDEEGICASSGSACTTGSLEPSHVLRAMGLPYTFAHSATRFSLSRYNTEADIDAVISALPPIISKLRELSPYVNSNQTLR